MSRDWYQDIVEMHKAQNHYIGSRPGLPPKWVQTLRIELIKEEIGETIEALEDGDLEEVADGIADSIVVLLGTAISYGIDIRPIWDEVHRANMAKVGGPKRKDGKQLKPDGWTPPQIGKLLKLQGECCEIWVNVLRRVNMRYNALY